MIFKLENTKNNGLEYKYQIKGKKRVSFPIFLSLKNVAEEFFSVFCIAGAFVLKNSQKLSLNVVHLELSFGEHQEVRKNITNLFFWFWISFLNNNC